MFIVFGFICVGNFFWGLGNGGGGGSWGLGRGGGWGLGGGGNWGGLGGGWGGGNDLFFWVICRFFGVVFIVSGKWGGWGRR